MSQLVRTTVQHPSAQLLYAAVPGLDGHQIREALRAALAGTAYAGLLDDPQTSVAYPDGNWVGPLPAGVVPLGAPVAPAPGVVGGAPPPNGAPFPPGVAASLLGGAAPGQTFPEPGGPDRLVDRLLGARNAAPAADPAAVLEDVLAVWAERFALSGVAVAFALARVQARLLARLVPSTNPYVATRR